MKRLKILLLLLSICLAVNTCAFAQPAEEAILPESAYVTLREK